VATVRTSLHNDSHWDRLSAAIICNMLVKVSWMSLISLLSVSVSSMLNKTPGKPLSVITKPATSTKLHDRNKSKPELNNQVWRLVINANTAKRFKVSLAVTVWHLVINANTAKRFTVSLAVTVWHLVINANTAKRFTYLLRLQYVASMHERLTTHLMVLLRI